MMKTIFWNFRVIDAHTDAVGTVIAEKGAIREVVLDSRKSAAELKKYIGGAHVLLDGEGRYALMPGFVDMHAHFRTAGFEQKECVESASLAAAAGGYTTLVCMSSAKPVIDGFARAAALKKRADTIGLVDLYPALSLTQRMEGKKISEIARLETALEEAGTGGADALPYAPPLFAERGGRSGGTLSRPVFSRAFAMAARLGTPVCWHCETGDEAGEVGRALALGRETGAHVHIAHVSTREGLKSVKKAKAARAKEAGEPARGRISCEVSPHHLALCAKSAEAARGPRRAAVYPPLLDEANRRALIRGVRDGTIDVIVSDHLPHTEEDKLKGAPGFSGLETAFAVCHKTLCVDGKLPLSRLSALLSAAPAALLGLRDRGLIQNGLAADLVIADLSKKWVFNAENGKSRGLNNPFSGAELTGKVLFTMRSRGVALAPLGSL